MRKFLIIFIVMILLLIPLLWFGGRWILSFSIADYAGKIELAGASKPIDITYDQKGIPQIWADNNHDLYFALGWVHASERLFQMELVRRFAAGKLSEIFGKVAYPIDLVQRKIGFARKAKQDYNALQAETLSLLQSYCSGINAWIHYKNILPPEFAILRLSPDDWKPLDCVSIALYQTWYSHSLMNKDYQYYQLIKNFGNDIEPYLVKTKDWSPATVYSGFSQRGFDLNFFPAGVMAMASNSWVISPQKSASGEAIHASDPHLIINQIPDLWYIVGLHSTEGLNCVGVTVPGLPFMAMGHTDKIAYSFTVASVDIIDYYNERKNPEDSLQVLSPDGYKNIEIVKEVIKIKDKEQPKIVEIYLTPMGVAIENDTDMVVSLKWAGFDFNAAEILNAGLKLPFVDNFNDFRQTVTKLGALDVNWIYSDIDGNIGYQLGTPIPKRDYVDTFSRLQGENLSYQWKGYYSLDETPHALNPPTGWLASCNNQIVSDKWPYPIPGFYDPYRIIRVTDLLKQNPKLSRSEMAKMQLDWVSVAALRWKSLMKEGAEKLNLKVLAETIDNWNGVMFEHGKIPAIFALWWEFLSQPLFADNLGKNWRLGKVIQEEVLNNNITQIVDNVDTPDVQETLVDISAIALDSALQNLDNRMYAQVSKLTISHPLSQVKLLDYWLDLNRGPYDMGGDFSSINVNIGIYEPSVKEFNTVVGPSMRFVLDWAALDSFSIILDLGESGNPFSPHYDDFLDLWQNGKSWIVPFSADKVYETKKSVLSIIPPNGN